MDESDVFTELEQDNNPLLHQPTPPYASNISPTANTRTTSPFGQALQDSFVDYSSTAIVNRSLGISQKIRKMMSLPALLTIDVVLTEKLPGTKVVVYLIELSVKKLGEPVVVKRRYLEFKSLRDTLVQLFPSTVVPPIPEKHSLLTYLINSIETSREVSVVEVRRRQFATFLREVVFGKSTAQLKECPLFLKFLDPEYEFAWENAMREPPASLLPQNLLLANPNNPTDQNGLYFLMPRIAGFDINAPDNLPALRKINDDLRKVYGDIVVCNSKEPRASQLRIMTQDFTNIPVELINFEANFHQNIHILSDMHRLNSRNVRNLQQIVSVLIDLGANLNNFSLQIHELISLDNNQLSTTVEKFGSTVDSSFLNFEHFLYSHVTTSWEEPLTQFIQYYFSALQLIKFYKYKLLQYKILYKLKFSKVQELASYAYNQQSIKRLKDLDIDSPSIQMAIRQIESKLKSMGTQSKSWYGLFGGNKSSYPLVLDEDSAEARARNFKSVGDESPGTAEKNIPFRIEQIEEELKKLDDLINLFNVDLSKLTASLEINLQEYMDKMERKWLAAMLALVRGGTQLFAENLVCWTEFREGMGRMTMEMTESTDAVRGYCKRLSR